MSISKYAVFITYHTVEISIPEVYAASEEQAKEIALIAWREGHTDKCLHPTVQKVEKRNLSKGDRS